MGHPTSSSGLSGHAQAAHSQGYSEASKHTNEGSNTININSNVQFTGFQVEASLVLYWMSDFRSKRPPSPELTHDSFNILDNSSELVTDKLYGGVGFTEE